MEHRADPEVMVQMVAAPVVHREGTVPVEQDRAVPVQAAPRMDRVMVHQTDPATERTDRAQAHLTDQTEQTATDRERMLTVRHPAGTETDREQMDRVLTVPAMDRAAVQVQTAPVSEVSMVRYLRL